MSKPVVGVIRTSPEMVLSDCQAIMQAAGIEASLPPNKPTILKDNISWHMPFLSANTTPWQLEGTILALQQMGYREISAVHNNTVVTNPYQGGRPQSPDSGLSQIRH